MLPSVGQPDSVKYNYSLTRRRMFYNYMRQNNISHWLQLNTASSEVQMVLNVPLWRNQAHALYRSDDTSTLMWIKERREVKGPQQLLTVLNVSSVLLPVITRFSTLQTIRYIVFKGLNLTSYYYYSSLQVILSTFFTPCTAPCSYLTLKKIIYSCLEFFVVEFITVCNESAYFIILFVVSYSDKHRNVSSRTR